MSAPIRYFRGLGAALILLVLVMTSTQAQIVPRVGPNKLTSELTGLASIDDQAHTAMAELDVDGVKRFAIVWQQNEAGTVPGIYLALVSTQGVVDAGPTQLLDPAMTPGTALVGNPAIAADRDGNFAVAWSVVRVNGDNGDATHEIQYQLFSPTPTSDGQPTSLTSVQVLVDVDAELMLNPGVDSFFSRYRDIDLAASSFGRYAVTFSDYRAEGEAGIYLSLFDFFVDDTDPMALVYSLQPVAGPILVDSNGEFDASPRVDINPNTEATVLVWRSAGGGIYARRLSPLGVPQGDRIEVQAPAENQNLSNYDPDVSFDSQNDFWITWEQNVYQGEGNPRAVGKVLLSRFSSDGNLVISDFEAVTESPPAAGNQLFNRRLPRVNARATDGSVAVAWQQSDEVCQAGIVNALTVDSFQCPLTVEGCGNNCFDLFLDAPPTSGICWVDFSYLAAQLGECRHRTAIVSSGAGMGTGWASYAPDRRRDFSGFAGETHRVVINRSANNDPTENRCVNINFSGVSPFVLANSIRLEQRCALNDNNCIPCSEQLGGRDSLGKRFLSEDDMAQQIQYVDGEWKFVGEPLAVHTKGANVAEYNVVMRYLHSSFSSAGATLTPQFQVNDHAMADQRSPAIGMFRNGEMMVAWQGEFNDMVMQSVGHQRYTQPVQLTINDVGILEGELGRATASFTVGASKPYPDPQTGEPIPVPQIELLTSDGTATFLGDDPDYERLTRVLDFQPGAPIAQPFDVEVLDDFVYEDTESYFVDMFNEENAVVVRRQGLGAIIDNDPPATVEVLDMVICEDGELPLPPVPPDTEPSCDESTAVNDNATVTLTLQLSAAQQVDGSVEFQTADGVTAGDSVAAIAEQDYEPVIGELQFLAGAPTQAFVTIDLKDNLLQEPEKNFRVILTESTDLTLGTDVTGVVRILNDDRCAVLPVAEPAGGGAQPPELPIDGGVGYLCVTNNNPADCPWSSRLDFEIGAPDDWIVAEDFPQASDVGDFCSSVPGSTGYIRYQATANMPPMPNQPNLARTVGLSFLQGELEPPVFQISQAGGECALETSETLFEFYPVAGEGSFDVSFAEPPGGAGICDFVGWDLNAGAGDDWIGNFRINGIPGTGFTGPATVTFEVTDNPAPAPFRQGFVVVSGTLVEVLQEGAFNDHFDDGNLPFRWTFSDINNWSEADTWMTAVADTGQAESAIASPAFPGCLDCEIVTAMRMDTFGKGTATLYAWYQDDQNHIALTMDEFADRFTLTQVIGGAAQVIKVFDTDVLVGTEYDIELAYDDSLTPLVLLTIDGEAACPPLDAGEPICEPIATPANGTVGFQALSGTVSFNLIQVTRRDGAAYPSETIFADSLED